MTADYETSIKIYPTNIYIEETKAVAHIKNKIKQKEKTHHQDKKNHVSGMLWAKFLLYWLGRWERGKRNQTIKL